MNLTKLCAACCALLPTTTLHAAKPHPVTSCSVGSVSCTCDLTTCTVSWTDAGADSYGVDVEFEAEWVEGDVDMTATAELDLDDDWSCDGGTCSATGDFMAPDVPVDADVSFRGKVKGIATGRDGITPRNFVKSTGIARSSEGAPGQGNRCGEARDEPKALARAHCRSLSGSASARPMPIRIRLSVIAMRDSKTPRWQNVTRRRLHLETAIS